jgi:hypothetical protein
VFLGIMRPVLIPYLLPDYNSQLSMTAILANSVSKGGTSESDPITIHETQTVPKGTAHKSNRQPTRNCERELTLQVLEVVGRVASVRIGLTSRSTAHCQSSLHSFDLKIRRAAALLLPVPMIVSGRAPRQMLEVRPLKKENPSLEDALPLLNLGVVALDMTEIGPIFTVFSKIVHILVRFSDFFDFSPYNSHFGAAGPISPL